MVVEHCINSEDILVASQRICVLPDLSRVSMAHSIPGREKTSRK